MNNRNYVNLLVIICLSFSQVLVLDVSADTHTGEGCLGQTSWSGSSGSNDDDCGICDETGTYTQSRNEGSCMPVCHPVTCTDIYNMASERTQEVSQGQVSLPEQQACQTAKTVQQGILSGAFAYCCLAGPAVCLAYCTPIYTAGMLVVDCDYDDCVYDCEISGWTTTDTGTGC